MLKGSEDKIKVGCVALSSPCHPEMIARSSKFFDSIGVEVVFALDPSKYYGKDDYLFSSEAPQKRVEALTSLAEDPAIPLIFSARGGGGALELLPLLPFETLQNHPKCLVGMSDTTCLLNVLHERAGWQSIHGPVFGSFDSGSMEEREESWIALLQLLDHKEKKLLGGNSLTLLCGDSKLQPEGRLMGGNISNLAALAGTPWAPDFSGAILFVEEIGESPFRIHRMLMQLLLAGMFNDLRAVVVGELLKCEHAQGLGPNAVQVLRNIFEPLKIPVYLGPYFGHGKVNFPLPLGSVARVSSAKQLELL